MKIRLTARIDTVTVAVTVRYHRGDPYALHLTITAPGGLIDWVISRELLAAGLDGPAGEADVRVTSTAEQVAVALSTPAGDGMLLFGRSDVVELLRSTYLVVPAGQESAALDWSDITGFPGVSIR